MYIMCYQYTFLSLDTMFYCNGLNKVYFQKERLAKFYECSLSLSVHVYRNANATNHDPSLFTQFPIFQIEVTTI